MSNIDAVNALITAINFDRFAEIEARHAPDVNFQSFRGPFIRSSVALGDWHRLFLKDYADCNYTALEYIEEGDVVAVRATIEAKGYDWRPFTQRILEIFRLVGGEVVERRLYGMFRDIEFDKPTNAAIDDALGYRGGSPSAARRTVEEMLAARAAGDADKVASLFHEKPVMIDGAYGLAAGLEAITTRRVQAGIEATTTIADSRPRPAFGVERPTLIVAGDHDVVVESGLDPSRARKAEWHRLVDGKIRVAEVYWMFREIGIRPEENYAQDRHQRQVILPI
jgi:ketosteroid isomerase-like protein